MSIKMTNVKVCKILAFGGFAVAGAFILDHSYNGGKALNFFKEKFARFKMWVAGDDRKKEIKKNEDDESKEANENIESNEAYPTSADTPVDPIGACIQANQGDLFSELD